MRVFWVVLLWILAATNVWADGSVAGKKYSLIRIVTVDQERLEIPDATVYRDRVSFEPGAAGDELSARSPIDMDSVSYLAVRRGSKAGQYAGVGALAGVATGLLAVIQVEADPDYELRESSRVVTVFAVLAMVGAGIGAAIGSNTRVFEPLRRDGEWVDALGFRQTPTEDGLAATLTLRF